MRKAVFCRPVGVHQEISSMGCDISWALNIHDHSWFCWGPSTGFSGRCGPGHQQWCLVSAGGNDLYIYFSFLYPS